MTAEFNIKKYDVGGNNAIAGDGKLTGSEVKKAQKDGWNVWDGYSTNDTISKKSANEKETDTEYINFEEFDRGGMNAVAGDGKLTGYEVWRANNAGYKNITENTTLKDLDNNSEIGTRCEERLTFSILRHASNKNANIFVGALAFGADMLFIFPELCGDASYNIGKALRKRLLNK